MLGSMRTRNMDISNDCHFNDFPRFSLLSRKADIEEFWIWAVTLADIFWNLPEVAWMWRGLIYPIPRYISQETGCKKTVKQLGMSTGMFTKFNHLLQPVLMLCFRPRSFTMSCAPKSKFDR